MLLLTAGTSVGIASASAPASVGSTREGFLTLTPSRPERVRIPGGSFVMGSSAADMVQAGLLCKQETFRALCDDVSHRFRAEGLAHRVTVSGFDMDRTEVTVQAYARCVRSGSCASPAFAVGDVRFDRPDLPVTHVRWQDAASYCGFVGARLPTEAEWEYAARGKSSRAFPWGNVPHPSICNHGSFASVDVDARDGYQELAPVAAMRDCRSPEGVFDLAGNVAEWVRDHWDQDEDGFGHKADPQVNPLGPDTGAFHVVKGGSYRDGMPWLRGAARTTLTGSYATDVGFRCVVAELPSPPTPLNPILLPPSQP